MIEILLNDLTQEGMRRVKVMSDRPVTEEEMRGYVAGASLGCEQIHCHDTAALSLFYGEVTWPCREVVEVHLEGIERPRRLLIWKFMPGEGLRLSEVITHVAEWYFWSTHQRAGFAFVRKVPKEVESGEWEVDGVILFEAEWALQGCVMVGG